MKAIVYSDYVCPFCFLEIPALERLAREEQVELDYRAFELRPEPVPTLEPRGDYLVSTWERAVYPMARQLGMEIHLPPVQPRSRMAFEGAEFARDAGQLAAYTRAVHEAFFRRGQDIGAEDVVVAIGQSVGLSGAALRAALADHRYLPRVLEQEREAQAIGISSVPTVIIGSYGIAGCQPFETLQQVVRRVRAEGGTGPAGGGQGSQ